MRFVRSGSGSKERWERNERVNEIGRLQLLTALVEEHLRQHGDDPQQSLAALSSVPPTLRQELAALPDAELRQTALHVRATQGTLTTDPDPTPPESAARRPAASGGR